jgi:hypothetical protein
MAKNDERVEQEKLGYGTSTREHLAYWARCARSHAHPDVESAKPEKDILAKFKAFANRGK